MSKKVNAVKVHRTRHTTMGEDSPLSQWDVYVSASHKHGIFTVNGMVVGKGVTDTMTLEMDRAAAERLVKDLQDQLAKCGE